MPSETVDRVTILHMMDHSDIYLGCVDFALACTIVYYDRTFEAVTNLEAVRMHIPISPPMSFMPCTIDTVVSGTDSTNGAHTAME